MTFGLCKFTSSCIGVEWKKFIDQLVVFHKKFLMKFNNNHIGNTVWNSISVYTIWVLPLLKALSKIARNSNASISISLPAMLLNAACICRSTSGSAGGISGYGL